MSEAVFVIRNQQGQYWTRSSEWVDGREPQRVLKLKHRDEAVNQLVELSARDIDLRGEILAVEVTERGDPALEVSDIQTPTLAEKAAAERAAATAEPGETGPEDASVTAVEPDSAVTV